MSIIFEGVDGTGKTTDAMGYLAVSPDYYYVHNWAKPKKRVDLASEITKEKLLLQSHHKVLFDRSFIVSEYVYASVLDRPTIVTKDIFVNFVNILNAGDHVFKLFTFDYKKDLKYKEEDKDLPFVELNKAYLSLTNQFKINKLIIENISRRANE